MELTRVDTKKLKVAVEGATKKLEEALGLLRPYLPLLTDGDRSATARAREGFPAAGRALSRAMAKHPDIAAVTEFDVEAVNEDLDNVEVIAPIAEMTAQIARLAADAKLTWLAEAWEPALAAYAVAKVKGKKNPELAAVVDPLAAIFATRRTKKTPTPGGVTPPK